MLEALILVCSLARTPALADCNVQNAIDSMRAPDKFSSPVTCLMHGQAFLAQTELGRDLRAGEGVKVVCARAH